MVSYQLVWLKCASIFFTAWWYDAFHDKIVLKSGVSIKGDGIDNSILAANNSIKNDGNMVEMDSGKSRGILI